MSEQLAPKPAKSSPTILPVSRSQHPSIDYYFDVAIHTVRRGKELAWESKELIVTILILILLIQHSWLVLTK